MTLGKTIWGDPMTLGETIYGDKKFRSWVSLMIYIKGGGGGVQL